MGRYYQNHRNISGNVFARLFNYMLFVTHCSTCKSCVCLCPQWLKLAKKCNNCENWCRNFEEGHFCDRILLDATRYSTMHLSY